MANQGQLKILKQGIDVWNEWRKDNSHLTIDLQGVNLDRVDLGGANLSKANLRQSTLYGASLISTILIAADLRGANLSQTRLDKADLSESDLRGTDLSFAHLTRASLDSANLANANLRRAYLRGADIKLATLREVNLVEADLGAANLTGTNLAGADLTGANLKRATLIDVNVDKAIIKGCYIYGLSVWDLKGTPLDQSNLVITKADAPTITVDDLEVAQFVYLLLNNKKVRNVIDTITAKVVLILGRFTKERKAVLDSLKNELRKRNYLPIVFDFNGPDNRNVTETVSTLAHLARFIIADITDPKSIPQELMHVIPTLPSVPVQPLILSTQREWGMFDHFTNYPWVLDIHHYTDTDSLLSSIEEKVIKPAEEWLAAKRMK